MSEPLDFATTQTSIFSRAIDVDERIPDPIRKSLWGFFNTDISTTFFNKSDIAMSMFTLSIMRDIYLASKTLDELSSDTTFLDFYQSEVAALAMLKKSEGGKLLEYSVKSISESYEKKDNPAGEKKRWVLF